MPESGVEDPCCTCNGGTNYEGGVREGGVNRRSCVDYPVDAWTVLGEMDWLFGESWSLLSFNDLIERPFLRHVTHFHDFDSAGAVIF